MVCNSCNKELPADANFCPNCGQPQESVNPRPVINYAPETCGYCKGSGKDFAQACPICKGQGSVLVAQPARKCVTCDGGGKHFTSVCEACGGSGWAHTYRE